MLSKNLSFVYYSTEGDIIRCMSFDIFLRNIPIRIKTDEVRRYLGEYRGITVVPERINAIIKKLSAISRAFINASASSRAFKIALWSEDGVETEAMSLPGRDISKLLKEASEVIFCATTIGSRLEEKINELLEEKRTLEAMILDAIGSTAADTAMDYLNNLLKAEATRRRLTLTRRYSPGYGDLPLSIQGNLLRASGGDKLGIKVSPSYMLIPKKSVTAVIGVMKI